MKSIRILQEITHSQKTMSSLKRAFQQYQAISSGSTMKWWTEQTNTVSCSTIYDQKAQINLRRFSSSSSSSSSSSKNDSPLIKPTSVANNKLRTFVPRKAAVQLTESARTFFRKLLHNPPRPEIIGILLSYRQATDAVRMVFHVEFITQVPDMAEGVSLELLEDGKTPKPPEQSQMDGLPKLYIHPDAFLKVLGATVDVNGTTKEIQLLDREGNPLDPDY